MEDTAMSSDMEKNLEGNNPRLTVLPAPFLTGVHSDLSLHKSEDMEIHWWLLCRFASQCTEHSEDRYGGRF